ncbi:BTB/POZ domain-containing protein 9 [Tetrabaena socialis]|uniref:BTB/POZ domain-containing protein 9 n=1 Tax=Tetrabaena socialis TaxID=47790 RepID=A0A2J8AB19_9CHLO|nr:BTB/POZ domain-containing protein 9 [Tetrabaena socialis]|eukprot:PNH09663.1 BTB/POZ domain-containing protein 9 [Tetrabaena socialis]
MKMMQEGEVIAGGIAFPTHRCVLAARCPYFERLFAGGFADRAAHEIALPDTEGPAFAAILRHFYTGSTSHLQGRELLRPVAVLADRLLLPALSTHAQQQLLSAVTPASVAADLVAQDAAGSLGELAAAASPGLMGRLLVAIGRAPPHV